MLSSPPANYLFFCFLYCMYNQSEISFDCMNKKEVKKKLKIEGGDSVISNLAIFETFPKAKSITLIFIMKDVFPSVYYQILWSRFHNKYFVKWICDPFRCKVSKETYWNISEKEGKQWKKLNRSNLRFFRFVCREFSILILSFIVTFSIRNKKSYVGRMFILIPSLKNFAGWKITGRIWGSIE